MKVPEFNNWEEIRNWVENLQPGTTFECNGNQYLRVDTDSCIDHVPHLICVDDGKLIHFSKVLKIKEAE